MREHFDRVRAVGVWSRCRRLMAGLGGLFAGRAAELDQTEAKAEADAPAAGYGDHVGEPGAARSGPAGGDPEIRLTHSAQVDVV